MSVLQIGLNGQTINVVSLPTSPERRQVQFDMNDSVGEVTSIFTGESQLQEWPGADLLSGTMTLPPLTQDQADDWISFLMQCRGKANSFLIGDPLKTSPRGSGSGTPFADNTQNNGNPAGSQFLGTKGWTPNAQGVLRRGDWFSLNWRLYRALDDVNADGSGKALIPIWPSLRETPPQDGTSNTWQNASGAISLTATGPLGGWGFWAFWDTFAMAPGISLPDDAVIQGIYAVIVLSAGTISSDPGPGIWYGPGIRLGDSISPGGSGTIGTPGVPFSTTECYAPTTGPSIGTSLDVLNDQGIYVQVWQTLEAHWSAAVNITGVGFAIYYTSATPVTDGSLPPPFAVPSGQGLAWAMPAGALTGIINPTPGGSVAAAPASPNGQIGLKNPQGLFRLAVNKRSWSADVSRASSISFPIQEYR